MKDGKMRGICSKELLLIEHLTVIDICPFAPSTALKDR